MVIYTSKITNKTNLFSGNRRERIRLYNREVSRVPITLFHLFMILTLLREKSLQTAALLMHKATLQSSSNNMIPTMFSFN